MGKLAKSLVLIGFQASGKTTLGKQLAIHWDAPFVDTDQEIERFHPPLSCREIFQAFGSGYFRSLEAQVICSIKNQAPLILATGGGSLLQTSHGTILKSYGVLVYLKTSEAILKRRIWQRHALPAYLESDDPHQTFTALFRERSLLYEKWADRILEMDGLNEGEALKKLVHLTES